MKSCIESIKAAKKELVALIADHCTTNYHSDRRCISELHLAIFNSDFKYNQVRIKDTIYELPPNNSTRLL